MTEQYKCTSCGMIPSNQDLVHKRVANGGLRDKCNRCGGKHVLTSEGK